MTRRGNGPFFLDMSATDMQHARPIIISQATALGSLSSPTVPSEMTASEIQRLVVYSAESGPLVSGCSGAVLARRCEAVSSAAHSMGLRVVAGIYEAIAGRLMRLR